MLRNFHYIDDKGKDQGINGTPSLSRIMVVSSHNGFQSVTALRRSLSYLRMLRKSGLSGAKQSRTSQSTPEPGMTACLSHPAVRATAGLEARALVEARMEARTRMVVRARIVARARARARIVEAAVQTMTEASPYISHNYTSS